MGLMAEDPLAMALAPLSWIVSSRASYHSFQGTDMPSGSEKVALSVVCSSTRKMRYKASWVSGWSQGRFRRGSMCGSAPARWIV